MMVLGSVAIVAGGSLYFMKNQQTASQLHSKNLLNSEVNGVAQVIQTILTRSGNCTVTLAGKSVGDDVPAIKTTEEFDPIYDSDPDYFKPKGGTDVIKVGQMIGHRINIDKMELVKQDFVIKDVTENLEAIKVTFKGENLDTSGSKSLARYFIIRGEREGAGYKFCYSEPLEFDKDVLKTSLNELCSTSFASEPAGQYYCNWDALPKCTLTQPGECSTKVYTKEAEVSIQERTQTRMECRTRYVRKCLIGGNKTFYRTCTCTAGPTVSTCNCNNGSVTCYSKDWHICSPKHVYKTVKLDRCCRKDLPLGASSQPPTPGASVGGNGGGGGGCFVAGTRISLAGNEFKNIEDVKSGDKLLDGTGKTVIVKSLLRYDHKGLVFSINGGRHFFTANHPFLTLDGWKSLDPKKTMTESPDLKVALLQEGDVVLKLDGGMETIFVLDSIESEEKVYNFTVSGNHQYVADDYIVHNKAKLQEEDGQNDRQERMQ